MSILNRLKSSLRRAPDQGVLYLHVGLHKTGTTAFQRSLIEAIDDVPWRVLLDGAREPIKQVNNARFAHCFLRPEIVTLPRWVGRPRKGGVGSMIHQIRIGAPLRQEVLEETLAWLREDLDTPALISAEAFTFLRTKEEQAAVRSFFAKSGRKLVIVLMKRNEADWRRSWNKQLAMNQNPRAAGYASVPDEKRSNGEWYFDFEAVRDFWADLGELRVLDYDEALQVEGNVLPALYRAVDLDPNQFNMDVRANVTNEKEALAAKKAGLPA